VTATGQKQQGQLGHVACSMAQRNWLRASEQLRVTLEQLLQPDSSTVSPCTDPMRYFTYIACQTPSEASLELNGQALAAVCMRNAQVAAMKLHQLATATPSQRSEIVQQMAASWKT
jgi:hypothetical protein